MKKKLLFITTLFCAFFLLINAKPDCIMGANAKIIVPQETNSEFVSSQNEDTEFSVPDQPASNQSSSIKCAKKLPIL